MKKVVNHIQEPAIISVLNLSKEVVSNKLVVYRRESVNEEFAILRKVSQTIVGFVSLIGKDYSPCFVTSSYKKSMAMAAAIRNLYVFDSLEEFMNNKHLL